MFFSTFFKFELPLASATYRHAVSGKNHANIAPLPQNNNKWHQFRFYPTREQSYIKIGTKNQE